MKPNTALSHSLLHKNTFGYATTLLLCLILTIPTESRAAATMIEDVPAYTDCFGTAITCAGMLAAYLDRHGYPNIYTGPANNGRMPLNNDDYWTTWEDMSGKTWHRCPLVASQQGLDGRTERGHVDDYWKQEYSTTDPFTENGWTEHTFGDCVADYMHANQYSWPFFEPDGQVNLSTKIDGSKNTLEEIESTDAAISSGLVGLKDFFQSRGYTVVEGYSQSVYPHPNGDTTQGFTFEDCKALIDSGYPFILTRSDHNFLVVGYDDATGKVYVHTCSDHEVHATDFIFTVTTSSYYPYFVTVIKLDPDEREETPTVNPAVNLLLLSQ